MMMCFVTMLTMFYNHQTSSSDLKHLPLLRLARWWDALWRIFRSILSGSWGAQHLLDQLGAVGGPQLLEGGSHHRACWQTLCPAGALARLRGRRQDGGDPPGRAQLGRTCRRIPGQGGAGAWAWQGDHLRIIASSLSSSWASASSSWSSLDCSRWPGWQGLIPPSQCSRLPQRRAGLTSESWSEPWGKVVGVWTCSTKLCRSDADFVDIIHTNSGNLWDGCLSFPEVLFSLWSWLQNSPSQFSGPRTHRLLPRWWLPPGEQDQLWQFLVSTWPTISS